MIQISDLRDSEHQKAFSLFESGAYQECLAYLHDLPFGENGTSLRILEAMSLYLCGDLDEAEVCFRDLKRIVPDSAEVCLYLGRILEQRGDESAHSEYESAVRLDPENKEAIRRYARYLCMGGDYPSAVSFLIRLTTLSDNPEDLSLLLEVFRLQGRFSEAEQIFLSHGSPEFCLPKYLQILYESGAYSEVVRKMADHSQGPDSRIQRWYLVSLGMVSPDAAHECWLRYLQDTGDRESAGDYVRVLTSHRQFREAVGVWSTHLSAAEDPNLRLLVIDALRALGEKVRALNILRAVLFPVMSSSPEQIRSSLRTYLSLLKEQYPEKAYDIFLHDAGSVPHPTYLVVSGEVCEETGMQKQAHALFHHAFRSDLSKGGVAYVRYLLRHGDTRECEKVLIYILQHLKKTSELEYVGDFILSMDELKRHTSLLEQMNLAYYEKKRLLSTRGRTTYAECLSHIADNARENGLYGHGIRACLKGLAVVPSSGEQVAEHLYATLISCKMQDLPFYEDLCPGESPTRVLLPQEQETGSLPDLEPVEEKILNYLRKHRICHEMDLRAVAGTRRVAGLMNRLIRKAEEQGVHLIKKEGCSEFGEVYRYG